MKVRAWVFWRPACIATEVRVGRDGALVAADDAEWGVAREERAALVLARAVAGEAVEVVSWAPPEAEPTLRQALALGARRVWRVGSPAGAEDDVVATARGLVEAVEVATSAPQDAGTNNAGDGGSTAEGETGETREVWFFGAGSLDYGRGAVGPAVAGLLGRPLYGNVSDAAPIAALLEKPARRAVTARTATERRAAVVVVGREARQPAKPSVIALARLAGRTVDTIALPAEAGWAAAETVRVTGRESVVPRRRLGEVVAAGEPEEAVRLLLARLRERRAF